MSKFNITNQLNSNHKKQLLAMYQHEWWSVGRTKDDVETILSNSSFIIAVTDNTNDKLAGFSRILTDYFKFSYVYDVIVEISYRNQEVGKLLLNAITNHPKLQRIENIELVCRKELKTFIVSLDFLKIMVNLLLCAVE